MTFDSTQFRQEPIYRSSAPVESLLGDLPLLGQVDQEAEKTWRMWSKVGWSSIGLAAVTVFLGPCLSVLGPSTVLALGGGGGVVALIAFVLRSSHKRLDLENRRYELGASLLRLLKADMDPAQPMDLSMDLRAMDEADKLTGEGKVRDWNVKFYADPWLSLRGRLLDGTRFHLGMTQKLQKRSRWKRTPRGKHKHKSKTKGQALASVELRVKPEKHPELARLGQRARGAVRLPEGVAVRRFEVTADSLLLEVVLSSEWEKGSASRAFAMMLMSCYQVLQLSRSLDKKVESRRSA